MSVTRENKENLGERDTNQDHVFKSIREKVFMEENATRVRKNLYGESFILGNSQNGVLGTWTGTQSGSQLVLGESGRSSSVQKVINPNNTHRERFVFDRFKDSGNTTADWDTTDQQLEMTDGEVATSLSVYKDSTTITEATLSLAGTNTDSATPELSADGGSNWEEVTPNSQHIFTNTGTDLRWRLTASGGTPFTLTFPITFGGNPTIRLLKIIYG